MADPCIDIPEPSAPFTQDFTLCDCTSGVTPLSASRSGLQLWQGSKCVPVPPFSDLFDCQSAALYQHIYKPQAVVEGFVQPASLYNPFDPLPDEPVLLFKKSNNIKSRPPNNDETQCSHAGNCISLLLLCLVIIWKCYSYSDG